MTADSTPHCSWCGASLADARPRRDRLDCRACGCATTHPQPTHDDLANAYGSWYRPDQGRFGGALDAFLRRTRAGTARWIDDGSPPGPVLDVGAGDGTLVRALAKRGRSATGIDRAPAPGVDVAELDEVEGRFAAIVFWHSLEHLRAPRAAVRSAQRLLVPGGVLYLAVPNYGSLQARAFGDRWLALDIPRHLSHLTATALEQGLRADGWDVRRTSDVRGGQGAFGWLHGLVGLLPGRPDLYQAIRVPAARSTAISRRRIALTGVAATILAPVALLAAAAETLLGHGGSVYLEAVNA